MTCSSRRNALVTTFHRIWFGDATIPERYEQYWRAWQRQFPQCRFVTWTDADIDRLPLSRDRLQEFTSHATRADLARYEILHAEGGIYLDCDIRPHLPFAVDDMTSRLTVCNETEATDYCSIGFIATPPGHPLFLELTNHILQSPIDETRPNVSTGPWLFGAALQRHPHRRLPPAAFYPYLYDEPLAATRMRDLDQTFGVHIWGGSWLTPAAKQDIALKLLGKGDIAETAAIVARLDGPWAQDAAAMIDTIRDIREKTLQVGPALFPDLAIRPHDRPAFEFAKVVDWLLSQDADRMVWQIGAADGTLVDPLRPALVNYDPPAVLLEPNPHLFAMLKQAYAGNCNSRLLPVAYGTRAGTLILNAIDPARAVALALPDWVLGISSVYDDRKALGGKTIDAATTERIHRCIDRIPVPVIDHPMMLAEAGGRAPDILVVDAEGMDREIIDDILVQGARPQVIHFEIQCLDPADQQGLLAALAEHYAVIAFGNDMTAYRHDVMLDYARALYVEHGLPTIFAGAVAGINGLA
ncbi:glycosyltransferase [Sphingomonas taxi]|uniref:glycosyltransferase n=1 Tax=Sphingomonas taxi TaxID=1549858 RepID=UPI0009DFB5D2|nr:glycosyltransferase [Sphingomonas taxi]